MATVPEPRHKDEFQMRVLTRCDGCATLREDVKEREREYPLHEKQTSCFGCFLSRNRELMESLE